MYQFRNRFKHILFVLPIYALVALLASCDSIKASADLSDGRLKSASAIQKAREQAGGNFALAFWDPFINISDFDKTFGEPIAYHPGESIKPKKHHPAQIGLLVQPEFVQKGSVFTSASKLRVNYLELQAYACYRTAITQNLVLTAGIGPYFSYAVGGHSTTTISGSDKKTKIFGGTSFYHHGDAGAALMAEVRVPAGVCVGLGYDLGIANIYKGSGFTLRNRSFSLNIGYSLPKLMKMTGVGRNHKKGNNTL